QADGYHPVIGGAYVLHGDPNATLSGASSADLTRRWPAELTRRLATGAGAEREAEPEELLDGDLEGAGALRIALAGARLARGDTTGGAARAELASAYLCGSALNDTYAEAFVLGRYRERWAAIHPDEGDTIESSLEYKLAQLGDDRARVAAASAAWQ